MINGQPRVAIVMRRAIGYHRGLVESVAKYSRMHGPWLFDIMEAETSGKVIHWLRKWQGDGVVCLAGDQSILEGIADLGLPAAIHLSLDGKIVSDRFLTIHIDSREIGGVGAKFLLKKGLKNFGFYGLSNDDFSQECKDAFSQIISEHEFETSVFEDEVLLGGSLCEGRKDLLTPFGDCIQTELVKNTEKIIEWLKALPKPVGILVCNDTLASQIINLCTRANIQIPAEAAVLGINNEELLCNLSTPTLSSIALDVEGGGHQIAMLLDRSMAMKQSTGQISVGPLNVIARHSTDFRLSDDIEVRRAIDFICRNADMPIQVRDVAEYIGLSRRSLERRFLAATGGTIRKQIEEAHVRKLEQMLCNSDLSLNQIAMSSGFSSPEYMGRVFRRIKGKSLSDYRKLLERIIAIRTI